jgi:hypothetical protein
MRANLGATLLSQRSNDPIRLAPGGPNARTTSVSAADMTVTTITFGVNWSY